VVKRREQQKMIYNTLHIDQIIEQHEPHEKPGVILGAPEGNLILLLQLKPLYYSCYVYKPGDKS